MSQRPDVSVIIPAYNSSGFVAASIDSALSQQGVTLEVIVVDDGSTDDTVGIVESYGDQVRCIRQRNQGAYVARNNAAATAQGEWLAFLDADDLWAADKLVKQLQLGDPEVGLIYSDYRHLDTSNRISGRASDAAELVQGKIFDRLLVDNFIGMSTVLMRTKIFHELGGFTTDITGCADWDMWLRYAVTEREVRVQREVLASYRWHPGQMSKSFAARQRNRLEVLRRAIGRSRQLGRPIPRSLERKAYGNSWATAAWFAGTSDQWQALRWSLRALMWQPFSTTYYKLMIKTLLGRGAGQLPHG
jgi:glycosyltransferase involved in cell wall biosynthesis